MYYLGDESHSYVNYIGRGEYQVGNILYNVSEIVTDEDVRNLGYEKPEFLNFLTYDEFEQLKMYFV